MPRSIPTRSSGTALSIGCGVPFFAAFFVVGLIATGAAFAQFEESLGQFTRFDESSCEAIEPFEGGTFRYAYTVAGERFESERISIPGGEPPAVAVGRRFSCFVDRENPAQAVAVRRVSPEVLVVLIPFVFVLVGVFGMVMILRAALKARVPRDRPSWLPAITTARVPGGFAWGSDASRFGGALALCVFALVWNGVSAVPIGFALFKEDADDRWILYIFAFVFGLVGLGLGFAAVRAILVALRIPLATIVASRAVVSPGRSVDLVVRQSGAFDLAKLVVTVKCTEHATYVVGTDTRTETRTVFEKQLVESGATRVSGARPLELRARLTVPDDAMHSFEGSRNRVTWVLHLHGEVERWPDFDREASFLVLPEGISGFSGT